MISGASEDAALRREVEDLWPELSWIEDGDLREKVLETWVAAFEASPLSPADLNRIPFTLLVPDCPVTFMQHKRLVVKVSRAAAVAIREEMGKALPVDLDTVVSGAILADVGKLLEYEIVAGETRQSARGKALRHPFTGVHLALARGVPDRVCHIIAAHAGEGDLVTRSPEAFIVHHADFMTFEPFRAMSRES